MLTRKIVPTHSSSLSGWSCFRWHVFTGCCYFFWTWIESSRNTCTDRSVCMSCNISAFIFICLLPAWVVSKQDGISNWIIPWNGWVPFGSNCYSIWLTFKASGNKPSLEKDEEIHEQHKQNEADIFQINRIHRRAVGSCHIGPSLFVLGDGWMIFQITLICSDFWTTFEAF